MQLIELMSLPLLPRTNEAHHLIRQLQIEAQQQRHFLDDDAPRHLDAMSSPQARRAAAQGELRHV